MFLHCLLLRNDKGCGVKWREIGRLEGNVSNEIIVMAAQFLSGCKKCPVISKEGNRSDNGGGPTEKPMDFLVAHDRAICLQKDTLKKEVTLKQYFIIKKPVHYLNRLTDPE